MNVRLERRNDKYHFEAVNPTGNTVQIDSSLDDGGEGKGARPMELVLMGLGACASIDVLSILNKGRQSVTSYTVDVDGERARERVPAVFETAHLRFALEGEIEPHKAYRAVQLSVERYCSVAEMIKSTATITFSLTVNGEEVNGDA